MKYKSYISLEPDTMKQFKYEKKGLKKLEKVIIPQDVTHLSLSKNKLKKGLDFAPFESLETLWLSANRISSFDECKFPSGLKNLYLINNLIENIDNIQLPEGLNTLYLSHNRISHINGTQFPKTLKRLHLDSNTIESIQNITFPESLNHLCLSWNPLTKIINVYFPEQHLFIYWNGVMPMHKEVLIREVYISPRTIIHSSDKERIMAGPVRATCAGFLFRTPKVTELLLGAWWVRISYLLGGVAYQEYDSLYYNVALGNAV